MRRGSTVVGLDPAGHGLALADGSEIGYDSVVLATGCRARSLPQGAGVRGVRTLRSLADADRLRKRLVPGARVLGDRTPFLQVPRWRTAQYGFSLQAFGWPAVDGNRTVRGVPGTWTSPPCCAEGVPSSPDWA